MGKVDQWSSAVKLLTEYLEHAIQFEWLAVEEGGQKLKAQFDSQARAYRKLAAERAKKLRLSPPSDPSTHNEQKF